MSMREFQHGEKNLLHLLSLFNLQNKDVEMIILIQQEFL